MVQILMGDLNYRVALPAEAALQCMAEGKWDALRAADELGAAMARGDVFAGFYEAPVRFVASYRRVLGED